MIHFEVECTKEPGDMLYIWPQKESVYVEIAAGNDVAALMLSKDDMIRLRDALNEALPSES